MKKLLLALAVVAMAATSQAYAIKWSAINVKTPIAHDVTADEHGIIGAGDAMTGLSINLYWVNSSGDDVFINTFTTTDGKVAAATLGDGTTSDLYLAMLADQGDAWKPQFHFTATYETADGVYTLNGSSAATIALGNLSSKNISSTANFSTAATWDYAAASVPEPTSAMMLLMGLAGLALRRKQK